MELQEFELLMPVDWAEGYYLMDRINGIYEDDIGNVK